jgi:hypothetical protein
MKNVVFFFSHNTRLFDQIEFQFFFFFFLMAISLDAIQFDLGLESEETPPPVVKYEPQPNEIISTPFGSFVRNIEYFFFLIFLSFQF